MIPYAYLFRHKPVRVCIYARVSTKKAPQMLSLVLQQEAFSHLLKKNVHCILTEIYTDAGISGHTRKRNGFRKMLSDAHEGKFDLIITKSISRFARNTVIVLDTVRNLKNLGIGIYFESEKLFTLSGEGEFMLSVIASLAEEESHSISKNVQWTIQKQFDRGIPTAITCHFNGYDNAHNGMLAVNKIQADIIKQIFQLYLSGFGVWKIALLLNEQQIFTASGGKWNPATIRYILSNEKYKGDCLLQKYYTPECLRQKGVRNRGQVKSYYLENHHEAIIKKEIWNQAQLLRQKRCEQYHIHLEHPEKYSRRYSVSGLLLCPHCKKHLTRQTLPSGRIQWSCATHRQKAAACPGMIVKEMELEEWLTRHPIINETVIEEVTLNGYNYHCYTAKAEYESGFRNAPFLWEEKNGSLLPCINRSRRTAIQL